MFLFVLQGETEDPSRSADTKPENPDKPENPYVILDRFLRSACMLALEDTAENKGTIKSGK